MDHTEREASLEPPRGRVADWLEPCLTAFIASFCIMTLELVAGRIIARHLGASLYTWTAVIGIVLGGITIGNYAGGWIADLFRPRLALSVLFFAAAAGAMAVPFVNAWVGDWNWPDGQPWSARIFIHVLVVFLFPSTLLGLIGPVVAKMALDAGRSTGRTVGSVYAWGALGSIAGTFATGFWLIAAFGTMSVVFGVATVLALVGGLFATRLVAAVTPPALLLVFYLLFQTGWQDSLIAARTGWGVKVFYREDIRTHAGGSGRALLYVDESQYSYIRVSRKIDEYDEEEMEEGELGSLPDVRDLDLDNLLHARIDLDDPETLHYEYEETYRAILHRARPDEGPVSTLFIGGGGFVFPRFLARRYPGSHIEVAEIDPAVTAANFAAFGLSPDEARVVRSAGAIERGGGPIWVRNIDARNHVADLVRLKQAGRPIAFDVVFGDAFNDYSVPFHLTTLEFNRMVKELLTPGEGVYMINVIDIFERGKFLGAVVNTFREVFPFVYAFSNTEDEPSEDPGDRDTFIVVGALRELPVGDLPADDGPALFVGSRLREEHFETLRERSRGLVLTDDHAPVEQLLAEVVKRR